MLTRSFLLRSRVKAAPPLPRLIRTFASEPPSDPFSQPPSEPSTGSTPKKKQREATAKVSTFTLSNLGIRGRLPTKSEIKSARSEEAKAAIQAQLDAEPLEEFVPAEKNGLMGRVRRLQEQNPDTVLFVRVGEFYEIYFDQADKYGPLLGLRVISKKQSVKKNSIQYRLAGFPHYQVEKYIDILVGEHGISVALAEQFGTVEEGIERKVARIITPGTYLEEMGGGNFTSSSYLLAISCDANSSSEDVGFSWCDLSNGQFLTERVANDDIESTLARIWPREVVVNAAIAGKDDHPVMISLSRLERFKVRSHQPDTLGTVPARKKLADHFQNTSKARVSVVALEEVDVEHFFSHFSDAEIMSSVMLLSYISATQQVHRPKFRWPEQYNKAQSVALDRSTIHSLELLNLMRGNSFHGSLLHSIDRTKTREGLKLLQRRLVSPLTSIELINHRLDEVEFFASHEELRGATRRILSEMKDASRCVQKINMRLHKPEDLLSIASSLQLVKDIKDLMLESIAKDRSDKKAVPASVVRLAAELDCHDDFTKEVTISLDVDGILLRRTDEESGVVQIVNPTTCPTLLKLHAAREALLQKQVQLEEQYKITLHKSAMLVDFNDGALLQVAGAHSSIDVEGAEFVRHLKHNSRFRVPNWTLLAQKLSDNTDEIAGAEKMIVEMLCQQVIDQTISLNATFETISEVDVASSLAELAVTRSFVRPTMHDRPSQYIRGGRHPVVEHHCANRGEHFVENSIDLGGKQRLWLLTGPNMGGKSTFLRQNAIMPILAQMGSYVPAAQADLGIVDAVFSRVGTGDNLSRNQSTFMVEMEEVAHILNKATPRSLVIMDEVGRGTGSEDGFAIACASMNHLYRRNASMTIFATHFHKLADVLSHNDDCTAEEYQMMRNEFGTFENAKCYQTSVFEFEDGVALTHVVVPGISRKSHGLHVARMAGVPNKTIAEAQYVRQFFNKNDSLC